MMRWVMLVVLVVLLSAAIPLVLSALPTEDEAVPGLIPANTERNGPTGSAEVEGELTYEFGNMAYGNTGKHTWTIKNTGEGPLELLKGSSTCSCTVADFEKDPKTGVAVDKIKLKPGESHEITVSWTPKGRGPFHKETSIETNDPENPVIWFRINGEVRFALETLPQTDVLDVGRVPNSQGAEAKMALFSPDRPETKVLDVTTSRPELVEVKVLPLDENELKELKEMNVETGYRLAFTIKPTSEVGDFREEVVVKSDHPQMQTMKLTVSGRLEGPINVIPNGIRIDGATSSDGGKQAAILSVTDHRETRFEVASAPEGLRAEIDSAPKSSAGHALLYRMTVSVPPGTPPGVISGDLVIRTDHPNVKQLTVPVHAVVLSGN